jgi:hypothetical protein
MGGTKIDGTFERNDQLMNWLKPQSAPDPNRKPVKHFFELFWEELKTGHKPDPKNRK